MLVLNSRYWPENIWLLQKMSLDKQPHKNQNTKTYWNAVNTSLVMLHLHVNKPNFSYLAYYRILKFSSTLEVSSACLAVCLPASLPANRDCIPLGIEPSHFLEICYFRQHEPLLFQLQYSLCAIICPLFIHSNQLIFLPETKVLTFQGCWHSAKVLTFHTRC